MAFPRSTYRLQITPSFDLFAAARWCDYLAALGADAVYLSPLLPSAAGSDHGYDVVRFDTVDPQRGGRAGWTALLTAARSAGLKVIVDIVPNHAGVADAAQNPAWWDVLRLGRDSAYAAWFDIDWSGGRVKLPVLGRDDDLARLEIVDGELHYFEHRFPLAPGSAPDGATPALVHDRQHYELVDYRRADTEQNYRRFFAVSTLAGLRVEDEAVFAATHAEIARWLNEDGIDGLRVDHPDGLLDPGGYLRRLRELAGPDSWIVVEKILEPGEALPPDWPVQGATGYEALADLDHELLDPAGLATLDRLWRTVTGDSRDCAEQVAEGKRQVASTILRAEVRRLARLAADVADAETAIIELAVEFPVYRSYLPAGREILHATVERVRAARPELGPTLDALEPRLGDPDQELARRFQQLTGAVMAKGVEDTAFYRYNRFVALNEVGGDPGVGRPPLEEGFAVHQLRRQHDHPHGLSTLSTHDTKRGEDVRARLQALGEAATDWAAVLERLLREVPIADTGFATLLWQTVAGVGFVERERLHAYAEKAMREAGTSTTWTEPDEGFEAQVHAAIDRAYDDPAIRAELEQFIDRITPVGRQISLVQKLVQLTMPGVPDVYQGTELWEDSLVDPDNRRPVDFGTRRAALAELDDAGRAPALDDTGLAKLWVTSRALRLRRDRPELFGEFRSVYANPPLDGQGRAADADEFDPDQFLLAFDRGGAVTVATRRPGRLAAAGGWGATTLDLPGDYVDVLTGRRHSWPIGLAELLDRYPVALLVPAD